MSEELLPTPDLQAYVDAIRVRFSPAKADEATHFFSTDEVKEAIRELNPDIKGLTPAAVHDALLEAGFTLGLQPGTQSMRFMWLMKEK